MEANLKENIEENQGEKDDPHHLQYRGFTTVKKKKNIH